MTQPSNLVTYRGRFLIAIALFLNVFALFGQNQIKIAKLKYGGGGDWYANKTALPNLIKFSNKELGTRQRCLR